MARRLIILGLCLFLLVSCEGSSTDVPMSGDITLTFKAASFSDWRLDAVDGSTTVGATENGDPAITLEVGRRYRIINREGTRHPFALTNSATHGEDFLLSDGGTGSFVEDAEVNYVKNTDGFSFTLIRALATELKSYICTAHSGMIGEVKVTGL